MISLFFLLKGSLRKLRVWFDQEAKAFVLLIRAYKDPISWSWRVKHENNLEVDFVLKSRVMVWLMV